MKDETFTEMLDQLAKFQKLLASGIDYNTAYYRTYNRWHEDFLRENAEKKVIGTIEDDRVGMADEDNFIEPTSTH